MHRWTALTLTALVVVAAMALLAQVSTAGSPVQLAGPGTHFLTFAGTDFHPVDSDTVLRFAPNTGGGVYVHDHPSSNTDYLEAAATLPDGAQVTEVVFFVRNCDQPQPKYSAHLYFGSYTPSSGSFNYYIPDFAAPPGNCDQTLPIAQPISATVVVDNSHQRYVIGYVSPSVYGADTYNSSLVRSLLLGAQLKYQIPGAFIPVIRR